MMEGNRDYGGVDGYNPEALSKINRAGDILAMIGALQYKATEYYRRGELENWFYEWKDIAYQLVGKFESKDWEKLVKIESRILFILPKQNRNQKYRRLLVILIESYMTFLQKKMNEWGMGMVDKKDDTIFA